MSRCLLGNISYKYSFINYKQAELYRLVMVL